MTVSDFGHTGRKLQTLDAGAAAEGVWARFQQVVQSQPSVVAVVDGERAVTFGQLAVEAAGALSELHDVLGRNASERTDGRAPVAMLCGHDATAVATVFGVIASGHPLLVLDSGTPAPRLRAFVERVGVRLVLCDPAHAEAAAELGAEVVVLGAGGRSKGDPETLWADPPGLDDPAVLSFTSGSTGVPKVVAISSRQLAGDAWHNSTAGGCYDESDVVGHTLPMAFNAGICVTTAGPLVGATMVMYDVRGSGIGMLPPWLTRNRVTVMHASPAILRALVESGPMPELLASVRSLTVAGEIAHGRDVAAARRLFSPELTVHNRYGSSETGLICEFVLRAGEPTPEGPLPAGTPVGRTGLVLVDDAGVEVPHGSPGVVVVHREHLSNGYLDDAVATAAAFGLDGQGLRSFLSSDLGRLDEAGRLVLLGRRDHSVKIRGFLVEPGEVDAVLFAMDSVREALVVGRPRPGDGAMRLVAYVVSAQSQLNAATIRAGLRKSLPAHMVPEAVVFLEALPRTERGKLDRAALPDPPDVVPSSAGQKFSDWEQLVADAWAAALSLNDIGLDDDFFELGGDSLTAEAVMSTMTGELGVTHPEATTTLLVQAPTVRQFAARLIRTPEPGNEILIPVQAEGTRPPLFAVAGGGGLGVAFLHLARHLGKDQPLYALQARGLERRAVPDWTVTAVARRNIRQLRTVLPEGPYRLSGHSFGGLVAMEMAHQLRAAGQEVEILIVMDSFPPDPIVHLARRGEGKRFREQVREGLGMVLTGIRGAQQEQFWRFFRQSEMMHRFYNGKPYSGKTLVIQAVSEQAEQGFRWRKYLTGRWETVDVPGDHLSMLREPYVAATAEAVRNALENLP